MPLISDQEIRQVLTEAKTIAVVGWSNKPERPSHDVTEALVRFGYAVYRVNPTLQPAPDGPAVYASLADVPVKIDVVDIFRRAEDVPEVVEAAIRVGAKAIWLQLGIINEVAAQRAEEAGLQVIMNRCVKVEYGRLMR